MIAMIAVERIDQSRQTGRFACKSGKLNAAQTLVNQRGEWLATIARRARPFEDHFVAIRLETDDRNTGRNGERPQARDGSHALPLGVAEPARSRNPGEKARPVSIRVKIPGFKPAMVVVHPRFWQE